MGLLGSGTNLCGVFVAMVFVRGEHLGVLTQDTLLFSLRSEEEKPADDQGTSQHCLWVDEFAPQRYTELLSDDVRSCSCSGVTDFPVCKREESGTQLIFVLENHWAVKMEWGLWSAPLGNRVITYLVCCWPPVTCCKLVFFVQGISCPVPLPFLDV